MRKAMVSHVAQSSWFAWVVRQLERADSGRSYLLPILTYHRIADRETTPRLAPSLVSATPEDFTEQMRFLARRFRIVPMEAVLDAREQHRLPPRSLLLTFDDAYRDFADHAWPILRRLGLAATVFVPTGYPGRPDRSFWWDRLHAVVRDATGDLETPIGRLLVGHPADRRRAYELLRRHLKGMRHDDAEALVRDLQSGARTREGEAAVLSWAELRRLAGEGVTLAPHTRNHPILSHLDAEEIDTEVRSSREDLEREIGPTLPVFAYPSGEHTPTAVAVLRRLGMRAAFTTERGLNDLRRADWLRLRRINVGGRSTLAVIRAQLLSRPSWLASPGR